MNEGQYVFSQVAKILPQRIFDELVDKYEGNKYSKHFSCWNQLLCMIYGQISNRESLRDLVSLINAHHQKSYHLGFGKNVSLNNFAHANEHRDPRIFEEFMIRMIELAKVIVSPKIFEVKGKIYALDSTTVDLCLLFYWAKFRSTKRGIKIHTLFDSQALIPVLINITEARVHDVNILDSINFEAGSYYVMDKAYLDFKRLYRIDNHEAFFVTRIKKNTKYRIVNKMDFKKGTGVKFDHAIKLIGKIVKKYNPKNLRKVRFYDEENKKTFEFVTNNFLLKPEEIALLYKQRWSVELFFKWIKQHLKIEKYWGRNENAVRIQVYCAVITYCLIAILGSTLKTEKSTYEIIRILSGSLMDKTPINKLLTNEQKITHYNDAPEQAILLGF